MSNVAPIIGGRLWILAGLWLLFWGQMNSGPWTIANVDFDSWRSLAHAVRAAGPLVVFVATLVLASIWTMRRRAGSSPLTLWYGCCAMGLMGWALAGNAIGAPWTELYWILCYLAIIQAVRLVESQWPGTVNLERLMWLNFAIAAAITAVLLVVARDMLLIEQTAYGTGGLEAVGGVAVPIAAGFSRTVAIPTLYALIALFSTRGLVRLVWLAVVAGGSYVVWHVQSRGTIFALAAAFLVAAILHGRHTRGALVALVLMVTAALIGDLFPDVPAKILDHISRGGGVEGLVTMTGRTNFWRDTVPLLMESPIWGYGPNGDRWVYKQHYGSWALVHNTYLWVMAQSGIVGLAFFVGGYIWSGNSLLRLWNSQRRIAPHQWKYVVLSGTILAFFAMRSIPEISGPLFNVDALVLIPAMAYIHAVDSQLRSSKSPSEQY